MMVQTVFKLLINGKGLIFYFAPRRKARGFRLLTKEGVPCYARQDRMGPLKLTKLQNLTFAKKYRKTIKTKERTILFGNVSGFCLKITFKRA
jgi:hypothetical protein